MKALAIAGTAAMFLVGGGILVHGTPIIEHWLAAAFDVPQGASTLELVFSGVMPALAAAVVGIVAGAIAVLIVNGLKKLRSAR